MKALRIALALCLLQSSHLTAGNLLRIRVYHGATRTGVPTQTLTVFFWPEPHDASLQVVGVSPTHFRASSIPLFGLETVGRAHMFEWRLPPSVQASADGPPSPYVVTATIVDREGKRLNSTSIQFFVTRR